MLSVKEQCQIAKEAAPNINTLSSGQKNNILDVMAKNLWSRRDDIIAANKKDIEAGKASNMTTSLLDRLTLTEDRIKGIVESIQVIGKLDDPIGEIVEGWTVPSGIQISKQRVPLGVIGIIYEARPNVTADAIALSIKTGNAIVLRGSSSAYNSNLAISRILKASLSELGLNPDGIQLLEDTRRESIADLVQMNDYLDLIIPRGGAGLIQNVVNNATVPAIETGVGNCHIYVHKTAELTQAVDIIMNAKTQRPSVCNAVESLILHGSLPESFVKNLLDTLDENGVEIRGCDRSQAIKNTITRATEEDWRTEYLDLIISVKIADTLDEAIAHIQRYGSNHTECILAQDLTSIRKFQKQIDAAAIIVNASTRFTDGGEFGFGAELGISTQKLHARGPMGLKELTTYKYLVEGTGQTRQ